MANPKAKPYLDAITPYIGGKSKADGTTRVIKLSSNENPLGASPKAIEAFTQAATSLHRYPEDGCASLREAIGAAESLPMDQLICGVGSDEVLGMIVHAYAGVGDEVLFPEHAFLMYRVYAGQFGATPVAAPESNLRTDVDALLAAVSPRTKLVFVANPNNPTGSYLPASELARLRAGLRDDIILVLDGAYAEYMTANDYTDGRELCETSATLITHTFSKVYGLPALRVGWGYGSKALIDTLYRVRDPFNITQPAIAAAIAAIGDRDYMQRAVAQNNTQRDALIPAIEAMGLRVSPSVCNFILIHFDDPDKSAAEANAWLLARGIIVREVTNYGLPHALRMSIGTPEENAAFLSCLAEFVRS